MRLPALSRNPFLRTLTITRRLDFRSSLSRQVFEDVIDTLLSTCPRRSSFEPVFRRINIVLTVYPNDVVNPSERRLDVTRDDLLLHLVQELRWEGLDEIVAALGWDNRVTAAAVAAAGSPSSSCGISVHLQTREWNLHAQAMDIITARVSQYTRIVLSKT